MILVALIVVCWAFGDVYKLPDGDIVMPISYLSVSNAFESVQADVDEFIFDLRYGELFATVIVTYFSPYCDGFYFSEDVLFYNEYNCYCFSLYATEDGEIMYEKVIPCDTANLDLARSRRHDLVKHFAFMSRISQSRWYNAWNFTIIVVLEGLNFIIFILSSFWAFTSGAVMLLFDAFSVGLQLGLLPLRLVGILH